MLVGYPGASENGSALRMNFDLAAWFSHQHDAGQIVGIHRNGRDYGLKCFRCRTSHKPDDRWAQGARGEVAIHNGCHVPVPHLGQCHEQFGGQSRVNTNDHLAP